MSGAVSGTGLRERIPKIGSLMDESAADSLAY